MNRVWVILTFIWWVLEFLFLAMIAKTDHGFNWGQIHLEPVLLVGIIPPAVLWVFLALFGWIKLMASGGSDGPRA